MLAWLGANWQNLIMAVQLLLACLVFIFTVFVKGDQPEKFFKQVGDFLEKFSKK